MSGFMSILKDYSRFYVHNIVMNFYIYISGIVFLIKFV